MHHLSGAAGVAFPDARSIARPRALVNRRPSVGSTFAPARFGAFWFRDQFQRFFGISSEHLEVALACELLRLKRIPQTYAAIDRMIGAKTSAAYSERSRRLIARLVRSGLCIEHPAHYDFTPLNSICNILDQLFEAGSNAGDDAFIAACRQVLGRDWQPGHLAPRRQGRPAKMSGISADPPTSSAETTGNSADPSENSAFLSSTPEYARPPRARKRGEMKIEREAHSYQDGEGEGRKPSPGAVDAVVSKLVAQPPPADDVAYYERLLAAAAGLPAIEERYRSKLEQARTALGG